MCGGNYDTKCRIRVVPLPYTRQEVNTIGEMLCIVILTGNEVTKEDVLKRIGLVALVHIASHRWHMAILKVVKFLCF